MKSKHAESTLQQACVRWFRLQYPKFRRLLFSIPNGAMLSGDKTQRARQWARLEAEGATPGAADLFLSIASGDYNGLYIEMKTPKGSQSPAQKDFEAAVLEQGFGYAMPRTIDEFMQVVNLYFESGIY